MKIRSAPEVGHTSAFVRSGESRPSPEPQRGLRKQQGPNHSFYGWGSDSLGRRDLWSPQARRAMPPTSNTKCRPPTGKEPLALSLGVKQEGCCVNLWSLHSASYRSSAFSPSSIKHKIHAPRRPLSLVRREWFHISQNEANSDRRCWWPLPAGSGNCPSPKPATASRF